MSVVVRARAVVRERAFRVALLAAAVVAWGLVFVRPLTSAPGYDLSALVVGAKLVADGHTAQLYAHNPVQYNLADGPEFMQAGKELGFEGVPTAFVQAPLVAFVAQPLARVAFQPLARVWLVLSTLAMAAAFYLAILAYAPRWRGPGALAVVMLALLPFEPLRYTFWLGQTTPFVLLAMMGSLVLVRREHYVLAGLLMALPAFVKLTPLAFVLLWAWQRRWRAAGALAGGVAALAALSAVTMGLACNVTYAHRVAQIGRIAMVSFNNHSLSALLMRLGQPSVELGRWTMLAPTLPVRAAVDLAALAIVAAPAYLLRRDRRDPLAEGFVLLLILLVPSVSWTHYFVLLVPVVLLVVGRPGVRVAAAAAALALPVLCVRPLAPDCTDFLGSRGLVLAGPTLAALGLLGVLCYLALLRARQGQSTP